MPQRPRVTVLGSLNTDISVAVRKLPGPGETALGSAAVISSGGKGANQAVAAARLGAAVRMAGCVGDDDFGRRLAGGLAAEGVDTGGVRPVAGVTSGLALISVDPAGENTITVAPGANGLAGAQEVTAAFAAPCDVLILSAEVPAATLGAALARARADGVTSVVNLAPVPEGARDLIAAGVDWLVVNVPEAAAVLGRPVSVPALDVPAPEAPGPAAPGPAAPAPAASGPEAPGLAAPGLGVPDMPGAVAPALAVPAPAAPGSAAPGGGRSGLADGEPDGGGRDDAWQAAADLAAAGARHAVITLGAAGAVVAARRGAGAGPGTGAGPGAPAGPETAAAGTAQPGQGGFAGQDAGTARPGPGGAAGGTGGAVAGRPAWDGQPVLVPGFGVAAVDSVGAGDAFVGALAVALGRGAGPVPAVRAACAAGAAAVRRHGAQAALPGVADIRAVTGQDEWPQFGAGGDPHAGSGQR